MAIEYKKNQALFVDVVSVDEAETFLDWLQNKPNAKIDLSRCNHLHPANLQVLLASKVAIAVWPKDANLKAWLETVLQPA
ncbi:MAG: hypothetical protein D0531_05750 [Methylococcales bacterium]|nr:MAG: hypothetical protein D0531_05750 [Methylococcales bacterium]